jgi:DNA-directed RNA polymerase specialized sigma24 family protein
MSATNGKPTRSATSARLQLHDIKDVFAYCATIIHRCRPHLQPQDHQDLHAYLIATCWELSRDFSPGHITFSTWAGNTLRQRLVDWERQQHGRTTWQFKDRTYHRPQPTLIPYNPDTLAGHPHWTSNLAPDSHQDHRRIQTDRDRHRTRDLQIIRQHTHRKAA